MENLDAQTIESAKREAKYKKRKINTALKAALRAKMEEQTGESWESLSLSYDILYRLDEESVTLKIFDGRICVIGGRGWLEPIEVSLLRSEILGSSEAL